MCRLIHHIKFCTCNENLSIKNAAWVLYKHKSESGYGTTIIGESRMTYGSIYAKDFKDNYEFYKILVEKDLNNFNCFDFDYIPYHLDELHIKIKAAGNFKCRLKFRFDDEEGWKITEYDEDKIVLGFGSIGAFVNLNDELN